MTGALEERVHGPGCECVHCRAVPAGPHALAEARRNLRASDSAAGSRHRRRVLRQMRLRPGDVDPIGRAHLDAHARLQAKVDLIDRYVEEHGMVLPDGEPQPVMRLYVLLQNSARLALQRQQHLRDSVLDDERLATIEAEGRRLRLAAEGRPVSAALDLLGGLVLEDGHRRVRSRPACSDRTRRRSSTSGRRRGTAGLAAAAQQDDGLGRGRGVLLCARRRRGLGRTRLQPIRTRRACCSTPSTASSTGARSSTLARRAGDADRGPAGGASLEALPADQAGAWGLRPFLAVSTNSAQWGHDERAARDLGGDGSAMPRRAAGWSSRRRRAIRRLAAKVREHALADRLRVSETSGPRRGSRRRRSPSSGAGYRSRPIGVSS